ncbi:P-loop containing nucleoside triphosphate hydrolase protein [Fomitopsis serialis]|uniref:P-loop containing nucleoside triphosphate hydrolase protein n=1 Tax=Fomitopsis serialis TaxID=139415 RepID=UPI00200898B0|nr:P-loop containing nucleoside triphosphate hydrolase protein [Neoantrodia serialis]KAH9930346.1 P-loop containing nucleoside triphosphate hydrolase protein [Neoantrodia serialis]
MAGPQTVLGATPNIPFVSEPNVTFANTSSSSTRGLEDHSGSLYAMFTMFSLSSMPEWLNLIIMGGIIEISRRLFYNLWDTTINAFWVTISFDDEDVAYTWIQYWLARHPSWRNARSVEATTSTYGINPDEVAIPGQEDDRLSSRKVSYKPGRLDSHRMWYKGHYALVSRSHIASNYYRVKESLQISLLSWNCRILDDLVLEAKRAYQQAEAQLVSIKKWRHIISRPKRPMESIVLDTGVKELLANDTRNFLASKDWYTRRGIPFRRGYLLHGAPGSGKTSIIHSIAGELGLDVYVLTLSRVGLDDTGLNQLLSDLPERCIALLEDVDVAFKKGVGRNLVSAVVPPPEEDNFKGEDGETIEPEGKRDVMEGRVTLSGLLNALDGIGAQEGRILFATTNNYGALDHALVRPGRMDLHIEFKLASKEQARGLFEAFYSPPGAPEDKLNEKYSDDEDLLSTPTTPDAPEKPEQQQLSQSLRSATLPRAKSRTLAVQFAEAIPEREFSMASLQGYLMMYMVRPYDAARNAGAWVEKERAERAQGKQGRQ